MHRNKEWISFLVEISQFELPVLERSGHIWSFVRCWVMAWAPEGISPLKLAQMDWDFHLWESFVWVGCYFNLWFFEQEVVQLRLSQNWRVISRVLIFSLSQLIDFCEPLLVVKAVLLQWGLGSLPPILDVNIIVSHENSPHHLFTTSVEIFNYSSFVLTRDVVFTSTFKFRPLSSPPLCLLLLSPFSCLLSLSFIQRQFFSITNGSKPLSIVLFDHYHAPNVCCDNFGSRALGLLCLVWEAICKWKRRLLHSVWSIKRQIRGQWNKNSIENFLNSVWVGSISIFPFFRFERKKSINPFISSLQMLLIASRRSTLDFPIVLLGARFFTSVNLMLITTLTNHCSCKDWDEIVWHTHRHRHINTQTQTQDSQTQTDTDTGTDSQTHPLIFYPANIVTYEYWDVVVDSAVVTLQITTVALFCAIFAHTKAGA